MVVAGVSGKKPLCYFFADDKNIFLRETDINKLVEIIKSELFKLNNWI